MNITFISGETFYVNCTHYIVNDGLLTVYWKGNGIDGERTDHYPLINIKMFNTDETRAFRLETK